MSSPGSAPAADARLEVALDRTREGVDLAHDDATAALTDALLGAAAARRDRAWGRTVTYSPKVFLPVTNLCRDRCTYCTFRKDPGDPDAWTMTTPEISDVLSRGGAQK